MELIEEGVAHMGAQTIVRTKVIAVILLCMLLLVINNGCSQNPPRVYKVGYSPGSQGLPGTPGGSYNAVVPSPPGPITTQGPSYVDAMPIGTGEQAYHIGPDDMLEIKIDQLVELEKESVLFCTVDKQGQIYLPVLHHVQVAGLTCNQIRSDLIMRLGRDFIKSPKVDVAIKTYASKAVMVLGSVQKPGELNMEIDSMPLLDVIGMAGGLSTNSAPDIEILRGAYNPGRSGTPEMINTAWNSGSNFGSYQREVIPVSLLYAETGEQINPIIYPGDMVRVTTAAEGVIYISGEVLNPGTKVFRRPLNIMQAINSAGDFTNIAKEQKCKIIRRNPDGKETVIDVDLQKVNKGKSPNILLAQNDMVIVPVDQVEKFFDDINNLIKRGVLFGADFTYNMDSTYRSGNGYRYGY